MEGSWYCSYYELLGCPMQTGCKYFSPDQPIVVAR